MRNEAGLRELSLLVQRRRLQPLFMTLLILVPMKSKMIRTWIQYFLTAFR